MAEWRPGDPERRQDNRALLEAIGGIATDIALIRQSVQYQQSELVNHKTDLKDHLEKDEKYQEKNDKRVGDIKESMARWIGGGAVIMAVTIPLMNRVVQYVWK